MKTHEKLRSDMGSDAANSTNSHEEQIADREEGQLAGARHPDPVVLRDDPAPVRWARRWRRAGRAEGQPQEFDVYRAAILAIATVLVCIPLQCELLESLVESKPQPRAIPLAKSVMDALEERVESEPAVRIISAGRPTSHRVPSDVVLVLGAVQEVDPSFADELVRIVRQRMRNDSLIVEVHCVGEMWHRTSP